MGSVCHALLQPIFSSAQAKEVESKHQETGRWLECSQMWWPRGRVASHDLLMRSQSRTCKGSSIFKSCFGKITQIMWRVTGLGERRCYTGKYDHTQGEEEEVLPQDSSQDMEARNHPEVLWRGGRQGSLVKAWTIPRPRALCLHACFQNWHT